MGDRLKAITSTRGPARLALLVAAGAGAAAAESVALSWGLGSSPGFRRVYESPEFIYWRETIVILVFVGVLAQPALRSAYVRVTSLAQTRLGAPISKRLTRQLWFAYGATTLVVAGVQASTTSLQLVYLWAPRSATVFAVMLMLISQPVVALLLLARLLKSPSPVPIPRNPGTERWIWTEQERELLATLQEAKNVFGHLIVPVTLAVSAVTLGTGLLRASAVAAGVDYPATGPLLLGGALGVAVTGLYIGVAAPHEAMRRELMDTIVPLPPPGRMERAWIDDHEAINRLAMPLSGSGGLDAAAAILAPLIAGILATALK